jgi:flavin-dependent dehydrogenase
MLKADVLIIGGGPAGAACARRLKSAGVHVILLDKAQFPRFKPCAGWITPQVLRAVGLEAGGYPFGLTEFRSFDVSLNGVRFKLPTHQYSIRRYEFDRWLLDQAAPDFHLHQAHDIRLENGIYTVDDLFAAPVLVGAGGTRCPVYRTFFSRSNPKSEAALIVAQEEEFQYPVQDERCKLWFFENRLPGYAWYVPKKDGYVNVGVGGFAGQLKRNGDTLKRHWNLLVSRLEDAGLIRSHSYRPSGHSYYLRQRLTEIRIGNAYLVGDALGLATFDMGEGIGPAVLSGQLAAGAILNGSPYSVSSIPRYSLPSLIGLRK